METNGMDLMLPRTPLQSLLSREDALALAIGLGTDIQVQLAIDDQPSTIAAGEQFTSDDYYQLARQAGHYARLALGQHANN